MNPSRWNPNALGLCLGILSSIAVLITLILIYIVYPNSITVTFSDVTIEFKISWLGSIIAILIAFIHGYITGYVVAWLYNVFVNEHPAKKVDA